MKTLSLIFALLVTTSTFANQSKSVTQVIGKKYFTIEIDAKFPKPDPVDVLFVIDDSGSMDFYHNMLIVQSSLLAQLAVGSQSDFHIGVVTTSEPTGKLFGNNKILSRNTPDLAGNLAVNFKVGTQGSSKELLFDPVINALSDPLLSGENAGFFRDEAHLAIVMVTDTEDQGQYSAWDFSDILYDMKKGFERVSLHAFLSDQQTSCKGDYSPPVKIAESLSYIGGRRYNICYDLNEVIIRSLADDIFSGSISNYRPGIVLDYVVIDEKYQNLEVRFGNQVIQNHGKKGYKIRTIDDEVRLYFGSEIAWEVQPYDTPIKVTYELVD